MRYALINHGAVVNVILASQEFIDTLQDYQHALQLAEDSPVGVGWEWDGQVCAPPPSPQPSNSAPQECSPAQGLVALFALRSITEQDVHTAIDGIADPAARYTAQIAFSRATTWRRDGGAMQQLSALLGLSDSDLDALFAFAVTVEV